MIAIIAQFWFYFNSGADRSLALNIPPELPETQVPKIKWLSDDEQTGRKMEDYSRQIIMKDYIRAWYAQHLSYLKNEATGLKEYYTPSALVKVSNEFNSLKIKQLQVHQTDLQHNIQLHFYSADGQIVSFTDKQVKLKQRIYNLATGKKIYSGELLADYDVVMYLDDGYWRIKNCVRRNPSEIEPDTSLVQKENLVQISGKKFVLNNKPFVPKGINYYPQKTPWSLFGKNMTQLLFKKILFVFSN